MITTLNAYDVAAIPATGKRLILQDGNELVVDGIVKNLRFSPDSKLYAYSAEKDGKTSVVVNDRIIDTADEIEYQSIEFSQESKLVAYWARNGEEWRVHINGQPTQKGFAQVVSAKTFMCPTLPEAENITDMRSRQDRTFVRCVRLGRLHRGFLSAPNRVHLAVDYQ